MNYYNYSEIIPFYVYAIQKNGFHIFIKVKINNHKIYMLVDTGASTTVFDLEMIKKIYPDIEITENKDKVTGLTKEKTLSYTATISELDIGELKITNYNTNVLDLSHINKDYEQTEVPFVISGILGGDILVKYNAAIDYFTKQLNLFWE